MSTNGIISMTAPYTGYTPDSFPLDNNNPIIAPYWCDINTADNQGLDEAAAYYRYNRTCMTFV